MKEMQYNPRTEAVRWRKACEGVLHRYLNSGEGYPKTLEEVKEKVKNGIVEDERPGWTIHHKGDTRLESSLS